MRSTCILSQTIRKTWGADKLSNHKESHIQVRKSLSGTLYLDHTVVRSGGGEDSAGGGGYYVRVGGGGEVFV